MSPVELKMQLISKYTGKKYAIAESIISTRVCVLMGSQRKKKADSLDIIVISSLHSL